MSRKRISDLTDAEARAEAEALREELEEAQRQHAPLLALCWHDDDEPAVIIRIHFNDS
ncbi:MAG: hypothetical protein WCT54_05485 [Patescibacteria group bacterium]|jgi:hypothetical protein